MQFPSSLTNLAVTALAESLDIPTMTMVVRLMLRNYDINRQSGYPRDVPVPRKNAAQQIVMDIKKADLFLYLVQYLVQLNNEGYMGRKYPIKNLRQIISGLREQGIIYDARNKLFVEDPSVRKTRNWGTLLEGREYLFAFLRLDIVGNSALVRKYPADVIQKTYDDFRKMVQDSIDRRNGRIWSWEGDGGLVAFFFSNKTLFATISAMDIVHKLFIYNQTSCLLEKPLGVRLAVHGGQMEYTSNEEELKRTDIIKKVVTIESDHTAPNTVTVSNFIADSLDRILLDAFRPVPVSNGTVYQNYGLKWEQ
jgi:hypothetical protein